MDQAVRKSALIAIIYLYFPVVMYAHNQEYFLRGNNYYLEHKYQEAITEYTKMANKGVATWYNMGLCYFCLNQSSNALLCFRNAQYGASSTECRQCVDVIKKLYSNVGIEYVSPLRELIRMTWIAWLPLGLLQILFLATWFLLCWLLWAGFIVRWRYVVYAVLFIIITTTGFILYMRYLDDTLVCGVVREVAPIHIGPGEQYQVVGQLNGVLEVYVDRSQDDWCKVTINGLKGWVNKYYIQMVGVDLGKK